MLHSNSRRLRANLVFHTTDTKRCPSVVFVVVHHELIWPTCLKQEVTPNTNRMTNMQTNACAVTLLLPKKLRMGTSTALLSLLSCYRKFSSSHDSNSLNPSLCNRAALAPIGKARVTEKRHLHGRMVQFSQKSDQCDLAEGYCKLDRIVLFEVIYESKSRVEIRPSLEPEYNPFKGL